MVIKPANNTHVDVYLCYIYTCVSILVTNALVFLPNPVIIALDMYIMLYR